MEDLTKEFLSSTGNKIPEEEAIRLSEKALDELGATQETLNELKDGRDVGWREPSTQVSSLSTRATYSNSPLVKYTCYSPNHSGQRTHSIDTITIHMVVGQATMAALGNIFLPVSRQASSNYGVCIDGIALYVPESCRSWCSSSWENDQRSITIETASDTFYPFAIRDDVYNRLIDLCADICKRNGKTRMVWLDSYAKVQNYNYKPTDMRMTLHKWFASTACPGFFLESHMQDIANKVNAKLGMKDGWVKENGKWFFYKDNKKYTGWLKDKGKWYYLDGAGVMQTGWVTYKKKKYYCGKDGAMLTGWQTISGDKYYFKPGDSGQMVTGWLTLDGKKYYMGNSGAMTKGWKTILGKKYYFKNGVMVTGWYKGKEQWRYFNDKGVYSARVSNKYKPYQAKVTVDELNIRKDKTIDSPIMGTLKEGDIVTVVVRKVGKDSRTWGLLGDHYKKKDGWIAVKYTMAIN